MGSGLVGYAAEVKFGSLKQVFTLDAYCPGDQVLGYDSLWRDGPCSGWTVGRDWDRTHVTFI